MAKLTKKNAGDTIASLCALLNDDDELWASFADFITEQARTSALFRKALNSWLDERVSDDAFGTEAQNDPRGDQRDEG